VKLRGSGEGECDEPEQQHEQHAQELTLPPVAEDVNHEPHEAGAELELSVDRANPAMELAEPSELLEAARATSRELGLDDAPKAKPAAARKKLITGILKIKVPLIFTFRAREKTRYDANAKKPQDKIVVPLILILLATRPLDREHGDSNLAGKNFVGANGFGLAGNLISLAGGSPNIAVGIGAYGAAISLYRRWIAHGHEVTFARDTRLVLQTTPRTAAVLKPTAP